MPLPSAPSGHAVMPSAIVAATSDSLPHQAQALSRARAFAEPLLAGRVQRGSALGRQPVDRLDPEQLRSVYHEDAIEDHGVVVGDRDGESSTR